jgi:hypothetical protein
MLTISKNILDIVYWEFIPFAQSSQGSSRRAGWGAFQMASSAALPIPEAIKMQIMKRSRMSCALEPTLWLLLAIAATFVPTKVFSQNSS